MNQPKLACQRLQKAVNRLSLRKRQTAQSARGTCSFCRCAIRAGDVYKSSGVLRAHDICIQAIAAELGGSR
jgi:hypothetical protein